jgi:formylglycine-generating enzyme required for sulfatase activity
MPMFRPAMKLLLSLCTLIGIIMLTAAASSQQRESGRVALLIGNAGYPDVSAPLSTPIGDARALGAELRLHGFAVDLKENLDKQDMEAAIDVFLGQIREGTSALFYFSGYAIQLERQAFLVPVNAEIWRETDLQREAVSVDRLLAQMSRRGAKVKILIIDAARTNPFERRFRVNAAGLHAIDMPERTLAMYSAAPGKLLNESSGTTSIFMDELVKQMGVPDLSAEQVFNRVRFAVTRATDGAQVPWVSSSLVDEFRFGERVAAAPEPAPSPAPAPAPRPDPCAGAALDWRNAEVKGSVAAFEEHLARFPGCDFAARARTRIEELKQKQATVAPPAEPILPPAPVQPTVGIFPTEGAVPLSTERERALKPKDVFKECDACPEMVVVPAGAFVMGSRASEAGRSDNEGPQHAVKINYPFALGRLHVTVEQFTAFVADTGYDAEGKCFVFEVGKVEEKQGRSWRNPGFPQTAAHPAICLSLNDANAYVTWLSRKTERSYRLLTEAEWEYAARAGTSSRYFFGDDEKELCRYADGADQTAKSTIPGAQSWTVAPCSDGYAYTAPAGTFLPNAFGLHDMHGNAWQWVEDCWHANYAGAPSNGSAWTSGDCTIRAVRGGAWWAAPSGLRSAVRGKNPTDNRHNYVGARVARTLTDGRN